MLPHAYPFSLVERASGPFDSPTLAWTVNGALARGGADMPPMLALEMMAQSALVALPAGAGAGGEPGSGEVAGGPPRRGLLAGLDGVRFFAPVRPGDVLRARAELVGRFGRLYKARVLLSRVAAAGDETVAEGELLLALEEDGGARG